MQLEVTVIKRHLSQGSLCNRSCIKGRQLSTICQTHAIDDKPTKTGMLRSDRILAAYAVRRLLPSKIVNGPFISCPHRIGGSQVAGAARSSSFFLAATLANSFLSFGSVHSLELITRNSGSSLSVRLCTSYHFVSG